MTNDEFLKSLSSITDNSLNLFEELANYYLFITNNELTLVQQKEMIVCIYYYTKMISTDPYRKGLLLGRIIDYVDEWDEAWLSLLSDSDRHVKYYGKKPYLKSLEIIRR